MRPPFGISQINLQAIGESARLGTFQSINSQPWMTSAALEVEAKANFGFNLYQFSILAGITKPLNPQGELIFYNSFRFNY